MVFLSNIIVDSRPCESDRPVPVYFISSEGGSGTGTGTGGPGSLPSECSVIIYWAFPHIQTLFRLADFS